MNTLCLVGKDAGGHAPYFFSGGTHATTIPIVKWHQNMTINLFTKTE
jgi:hypothetical protein